MAQEHTINLNGLKLTPRDFVDFKRVTGKSIKKVFSEENRAAMVDDPDFEAIAAFSWIIIRKENPDFTYDDALDAEIDAESFIGIAGALTNPTPPATTSTRRRTKSN